MRAGFVFRKTQSTFGGKKDRREEKSLKSRSPEERAHRKNQNPPGRTVQQERVVNTATAKR